MLLCSRYLRLGRQHVHVPWQAPGDSVDTEADLDAPLAQLSRQLRDRVLGLGDVPTLVWSGDAPG